MTAENTNSLMKYEIKRITHRDYTGSLNHKATSSPQSNHWVSTKQSITDYTNTTHKEVTLNPTKPTHPLCTQQPPQARIPLTLQDFTQLYRISYEQLQELEQD